MAAIGQENLTAQQDSWDCMPRHMEIHYMKPERMPIQNTRYKERIVYMQKQEYTYEMMKLFFYDEAAMVLQYLVEFAA